MIKCNECGHRTILAQGHINEFEPDQEPYENGKSEDIGFASIITGEILHINIQWCPACNHIESAEIE